MRHLQSGEIADYAHGFYQNEFFNSISTIYTCDSCDKEYYDLSNLRKHVTLKHGWDKAQGMPAT